MAPQQQYALLVDLDQQRNQLLVQMESLVRHILEITPDPSQHEAILMAHPDVMAFKEDLIQMQEIQAFIIGNLRNGDGGGQQQ